MRVLYVDDDRVNSLLFAELARLAPGVAIECAGSGEEALEALATDEREPFGLLVLDLHLPDGDGFELLARLRQRAGRALPAYLCSADDPGPLEARAKAAGFEACWSKPLDLPQALAALRRHAAAGTP